MTQSGKTPTECQKTQKEKAMGEWGEDALKGEGSMSLFTGMKPSNWTAWTIFPSRSASFAMALLQDLQDALDDFAYSTFHGFAGVPISPPPLRELPLHSKLWKVLSLPAHREQILREQLRGAFKCTPNRYIFTKNVC